MGRLYDIVIYGATGLTGRMTVRHFARHGIPVKWAIAGRNGRRLNVVKRDIIDEFGTDFHAVDVLEASTDDVESIRTMARSASVLINCVGPFAFHGPVVVEACVAERTHYADITGEPAFIFGMVDKFDKAAKDAGVMIVPACGIDCIPADLSVKLLKDKLGSDTAYFQGFMSVKGGKLSGGTWQSLVNGVSKYGKEGQSKASGRRTPKKATVRVPTAPLRPRFENLIKGWAMPFPTADPSVVRRSFSLEDGNQFVSRYHHWLRVPSFFGVVRIVFSFLMLFVLTRFSFGTSLLKKFKKSGEGPTEQDRYKSSWRFTCVGKEWDPATKKFTRTVASEMTGPECYYSTAQLVTECALLMLHKHAALPGKAGGVHTTASAFGSALGTAIKAEKRCEIDIVDINDAE